MKIFTMIVLASTALVPATALAQGNTGQQAPTGSNQAARQGQSGQMQLIAISDIQGKDVYTARGESIGEVERVLIGPNNQTFAVVRFGEFLGLGGQARVVPISRMTFQDDRLVVSGMTEAEFKGLQTYQANMAGYRDAGPNDQARMQIASTANNSADAGESRIVVQRAAPTVKVNPGAPQVLVRQQQPQVTVNQAQPEIIVRQPQPTVRVDIPQPEITVRMPEPDVNVALAQPQVQVRQPQPQVQVQQPQQPAQVQVMQSQQQPNVQIQRQASGEPNVQVQQAQGQPNIRYERAEPRVIVNQAQGQPQVRIEQMGEGQQANAERKGLTDQERQAARQRLGSDVDTTAAVQNQDVRTQPVTVDDLDDMDVYNARGERLGDAERVVVDSNNRRFLVIGHGGFLGIGEDRVAFPIERFGISGDRLVIRGVTDSDIEAMDDYRDSAMSYRRLSNNDRLDLRVW